VLNLPSLTKDFSLVGAYTNALILSNGNYLVDDPDGFLVFGPNPGAVLWQ